MGQVHQVNESAYPSFIYFFRGIPTPTKCAYFVPTVTELSRCLWALFPPNTTLFISITKDSLQNRSKMQRYYLSQCALLVKLQEWPIQRISNKPLKKKLIPVWGCFLLS